VKKAALLLKRGNVCAQSHYLIGHLLVLREHVGATQEPEHGGPALAQLIKLSSYGRELSLDFDPLLLEVAAPFISDGTIERNELAKVLLDLTRKQNPGLPKETLSLIVSVQSSHLDRPHAGHLD
jgi:hypothetical protein